MNDEPPPLPGSEMRLSRWRYILAILIIGFYPIWLGLLSVIMGGGHGGGEETVPALGGDGIQVIFAVIEAGIIFMVLVGISWGLSRFTWRGIGGVWPGIYEAKAFWRKMFFSIFKGMGWSVVLRFLPALVIIPGILIYSLFAEIEEGQVKEMVPKVETLIDVDALSEDPVYLFLNLTLISFVVAGLREEVWRAITFFLFLKLFPRIGESWKGKALMVVGVALIFGIGHAPQGMMAIVLTMILGIALGFLQLWHRSIWEATMAHGFFDATTFMLLALKVPQMLEEMSKGSALIIP